MTDPTAASPHAAEIDPALTRYDAARTALEAAHRVDEVKGIRDKAVALAAYARQAKDNAMILWAGEIKARAERRAGELLRETTKQAGARGVGKKVESTQVDSTPPTLKSLGVTRDQSSDWQKIAAIPEPEFERLLAEKAEAEAPVTTSSLVNATKMRSLRLAREHFDARKHFGDGRLLLMADAVATNYWMIRRAAVDNQAIFANEATARAALNIRDIKEITTTFDSVVSPSASGGTRDEEWRATPFLFDPGAYDRCLHRVFLSAAGDMLFVNRAYLAMVGLDRADAVMYGPSHGPVRNAETVADSFFAVAPLNIDIVNVDLAYVVVKRPEPPTTQASG
jgi:PAS domain-containing protein